MFAFIDTVVAVIGVVAFFMTVVATMDAVLALSSVVLGRNDNGIYHAIRTLDRGLTKAQAKRKLAIMTVLPAVLFMAATIYSGHEGLTNTAAIAVLFLSGSFFVSVKRYA